MPGASVIGGEAFYHLAQALFLTGCAWDEGEGEGGLNSTWVSSDMCFVSSVNVGKDLGMPLAWEYGV